MRIAGRPVLACPGFAFQQQRQRTGRQAFEFARQRARRIIEAEGIVAHFARRAGRLRRDHRAHARHQRVRIVGLGQVIVGARGHQPDRLRDLAIGGGEHHGRLRQIGNQAPVQVLAGTIRQTDVRQHEGGALARAAKPLHCLCAALHPLRGKPFQPQSLQQGAAQHLVVFDQQYLNVVVHAGFPS